MKGSNKKKKFKTLYLFIGAFLILGIIILIVQFISCGTFIENETGQSALDQFSVGHFISGILICSLFLVILNKYRKKDLMFIIIMAFILTTIVSIGFELLENSPIIVNSGLKYNDRNDSFLNLSTDIILNTLGAILMCYIYWKLFKNKQK